MIDLEGCGIVFNLQQLYRTKPCCFSVRSLSARLAKQTIAASASLVPASSSSSIQATGNVAPPQAKRQRTEGTHFNRLEIYLNVDL